MLLVTAAALLASGCFKVNMTVDVNEDGSGSVEGLTAFNFEAIEGLLGDMEDLGAGEDEICGDVEGQFGVNQQDVDTFEAFNEDGFCGVRFSSTFAAGDLNSALGGIDSGDATLLREGDGWYFELPLDVEDLGADESIPGIGNLLGDAEYLVRVRLPGRQVEHNGEIDAEGFVVWDIDISNPPESIFLRTEPGETETGTASFGGDDGGGGSAVKVILIVVAVLAALGLVAWLLMRNRDDGSDEAPASGIAATVPGPPVGDGQAAPMTPPVDPTAVMEQPQGDFSPPTQQPPAQPIAQDPAPVQATPPVQPTPPADAAPSVPEPEPAADPQVIASPTPEQATGQPTWDPVRRKYVQWDPGNNRWLVHDDATGQWAPE